MKKGFAVQVYGGADQIPNTQLTQLGWILTGDDMESLKIIRLNDSDVLAAFGTADREMSTEKVHITLFI